MPTRWIENNISTALPISFWVVAFMALGNTFLESLTIVKCLRHSKSNILLMKWIKIEKFMNCNRATPKFEFCAKMFICLILVRKLRSAETLLRL